MLLARVITAVVLLALILPTIFVWPPLSWGLVTLVFLALAGWEWRRIQPGALATKTAPLVGGALLLVGLGWLFLIPEAAPWADTTTLALLLLATAYWLLIAPLRLRKHDVSSGGPIPIVLLLLACWVGLYDLREHGAAALIVALCIVWIADIGAYFIGKAIGRRKLAVNISPGKSWEGAIGGAFLVVVAGLIAAAAPGLEHALPAAVIGHWGPIAGVLVFAGLAALSVLGDLHESLLKTAGQCEGQQRHFARSWRHFRSH